MTSTANSPGQIPGSDRTRRAARWSILTAMFCFVGNFLANRLTGRFGTEQWGWVTWIVSWVTMLLVLGGILLGIIAMVAGWRQLAQLRKSAGQPATDRQNTPTDNRSADQEATERTIDSIGMAVIGFTLNGLIVLLVIYFKHLLAKSS
jgi:hypothetical protein